MAVGAVFGLLLLSFSGQQLPVEAFRVRQSKQQNRSSVLSLLRAGRAGQHAHVAAGHAATLVTLRSAVASVERVAKTAAASPVVEFSDSSNGQAAAAKVSVTDAPPALASLVVDVDDRNLVFKKAPDRGAGVKRPSVSELLVELPNFRQKDEEATCFEGDGEARVGCAEACPCRWYERCYPKHVLWEGGGSSHGEGLESINVGGCNLSMTSLVIISSFIFLAFAAIVFAVRGVLFIFAFMSDTTKMDLVKHSTPIRIVGTDTSIDDFVAQKRVARVTAPWELAIGPGMPPRDAYSAAL